MTEKILTTFEGFKDFFAMRDVAFEIVPMFEEMKSGDYFSEMINVHSHYDEKITYSLIFDKSGKITNFAHGLGFGMKVDEIEYDSDKHALMMYYQFALCAGVCLQIRGENVS